MSNSRMFSLPIVIRFNVFKYSGFCHAPSAVPLAVNQFNFQCVKKTLGHGVVITGGSAAHAAAQTAVIDQLLVSL